MSDAERRGGGRDEPDASSPMAGQSAPTVDKQTAAAADRQHEGLPDDPSHDERGRE